MTKFSTQFFATITELQSFVSRMNQETQLELVLRKRDDSVESCVSDAVDLSNVRNCYFGQDIENADISLVKSIAFSSQCIVLDIGLFGSVLDERGLTESRLFFMGKNEKIAGEARMMLRELKKITHAGVVFKSSCGTAETFAKAQRYTDGAAEISRDGIILRPIAGTAEGFVPVDL